MQIEHEMQTTDDSLWVMYILSALESFSWKCKKTTNHCIVYNGDGVHGHCPLPIARKKQFSLCKLLVDVGYMQEGLNIP
jgi:hypothetical protein